MAIIPPPHAPMFHLNRNRYELDLFFLFIFFHVDHFFALVMSAARADSMGQSHLSAIGAWHQVLGFQCIVRAATISAASGKFTLWLWGHVLLPVPFQWKTGFLLMIFMTMPAHWAGRWIIRA